MSDLEKTKRDITRYEALCARYDENSQWGVEVNGQRFSDPYGPHALILRKRRAAELPVVAGKIVKVVERHGPIKATDLIIKLVEEFGISVHEEWTIVEMEDKGLADLIESLVESGHIVEVEYVLPNTGYLANSLLFPANSEIKVRRQD